MLKYKGTTYSQEKSRKSQVTENAIKALHEMQRISELNGNSEMTLEEINAEIYAARREMETQRLS